MSKKVNQKRKAYAEKQEKQGQNVVKWIFIALIVLAAVFAIYMTSMYT
jgi:cell division protein FtsL